MRRMGLLNRKMLPLLIFFGGFCYVETGTIEQIYIRDNKLALKGQAIQLVCEISQFSNSDTINVYKTDNRLPSSIAGIKLLTQCFPSLCLTTTLGRYTFSADSSHVFVNITSLNRSEDQKWWTFATFDQRKDMRLNVNTVPTSLQFENPPSKDQDLAEHAVQLKCSTGCSYPKPNISWYYSESGIDTLQVWSSLGTATDTGSGCPDSDRMYSSTLSLPRYTTFTGNLQKIVRFKCSIQSFAGMSKPLYTNYSTDVQFAVYATTPTISNKTADNLVLLENDSITMECVTSATRPAATVTWLKGHESLTNVTNADVAKGNLVSVKSVVTFTPRKEDHGKSILCQSFIPGQSSKPSAQQTITVYWPPFTPIVPVTQFPFKERQTDASIICSSNDYGNPTSTAVWTKQHGTPDSSDSRRLNLPTLTSQMNGSPVSCQLINYFTQVKSLNKTSSTVRLNVEYTPIVRIMIGGVITNSVTKNESQKLSASCNATGNPSPIAKWTRHSSVSSNLIFDDIDRSDHGRYTCRAEAISTKYPKFVSEENLDVIVNYAPEVTIFVSERYPVEKSSLKLSCNATGRPSTYSFTSMVQTWRGIRIPNSHLKGQFDGLIEIQKPQLEDSGTYTCHVNNGIPGRNQKLDQTGKTDVSIQVSPKVLLKDGYSFTGAPGKSINISIPFYSNPDIRTVKFQFKNGTEILSSDKYSTSYTSQNVTAQFYGQAIELEGYVAVFKIEKEEQTNFINYTLVLENGIGQPFSWNIFHTSESLPLAPKFVNFTGFVGGVPTFLLMGNFNGGHLQTFVIETSIPPSTEWKEVLRFNETDKTFQGVEDNLFTFNLTGLSPNTYNLRVLAENIFGQINESIPSAVQFTILPSDNDKLGTSPPIAAIVGGLTGAVFAGLIVSVVIFLKRRSKTKGEGTSVLNRRGHESDDSADEVMTENQAYVSADELGVSKTRSVPDTLYAQPQKTNRKASPAKGNMYASENEDPSKLYAVPDKKVEKKNLKKQKNLKDEKMNQKKQKIVKGDIYENASELTPVKTDQGVKQAYEENPYENPEESKPKVERNKDGLIYADLTFNDQPKRQKKLVIHGLDSKTEYVEVDFTKKADPLPDSDEENK